MATSWDLNELAMYQDDMNQRGVSLDDLSQKCEDDEMIINTIAVDFDTWKATAPYLGIKKAEIKEIEDNNPTEQFRRQAVLRKWMKKKKDEAIYFNLLLGLDGADDNVELIRYILDMLKEKKEEINKIKDLESIKEEDMRFLCGCGKCTIQTYASNGCSNPWEIGTYPLLNIKSQTTSQKLQLFKRLEQEMSEVQEHFQYMVSCQIQRAFREQFGDRQDVVRDLSVFILAQQSFLFMKDDEEARSLKSELRSAETIADIFDILVRGFVSWFNHLLLGSITRTFHIAEEDYNLYVEDKLVPFLQRCLFKIRKDSFNPTLHVPQTSASFVLKFEAPSSIEGTILLPLRRHIAQILGVAIESFDICFYNEECFGLSVRAPSKLVDAIFPLSNNALSSLGSMTVACNGLKIVSVKYGYHEQQFSNIKISSPEDDSKFDYNSTQLSTVNRLFANLLVEIYRLDNNYLLNSLKLLLTHKQISPNFRPFFKFPEESIIDKLIRVLSFFNFRLLESVLKHLSLHNQAIKMKLQEFIREFECLKLLDLPPLLHPIREIDGFCSDFIKVKYQSEIKNVTDLISIRDSLASIHQLEPYSLILYSIDKWNYELKFLVVQNAEQTIMNVNSLLVNRLKDDKITRVSFKNRVQNIITSDSQSDSGLSIDVLPEEDLQPSYSPMIDIQDLNSNTSPIEISQTDDVTFNESTTEFDQAMNPFNTAMFSPSFPGDTLSGFNGQLYLPPSPRGIPLLPSPRGVPLPPSPRGIPLLLSPRGVPLLPSSRDVFSGQPYPHPSPSPRDAPFNGHFYPSQYPQDIQMMSNGQFHPSNINVPAAYNGQFYHHPFVPFPDGDMFGSGRGLKDGYFPAADTQNVGVVIGKRESSVDEEWPDFADSMVAETRTNSQFVQDAPTMPVVSFETGKKKQGVYKVCKICLASDCNHEQLADRVCLRPHPHNGKAETFAHWNHDQRRLVEVLSSDPFTVSTPVTFTDGHAYPPGPSNTNTDKQKERVLDKTLKPTMQNRDTNTAPLSPSRKQIKPTVQNKYPSDRKDVGMISKRSNDIGSKTPFRNPPIESKHVSSHKEREAWKCDFQQRLDNALLQNEEHFESDLSRQNYRDKFYHLLCYEESEHISLLTEKCDGQYELIFFGEEELFRGEIIKLGCIRGMNGDQMQYASQASEGLFIVNPITREDICRGDLSPNNYYHIDQDFEIEILGNGVRKLQEANLTKVRGHWYRVNVEFEVKHSYFNTLHRAVISIPQSIIAKLLPDKITLLPNLPHVMDVKPACHQEDNLSVDEDGQLSALEAIIKKPPLAPIILTGPFGSGKTRILARSAFEFVKIGLKGKLKTRILICAHHSNTVDAYRTYLTSVLHSVSGVKIIQIVNPRKRDFYQQPIHSNCLSKTISEFKRDIHRRAYMKDTCIMVITTYTTSLKVSDVLSLFGCVFTHVLLDEAAQIREPEAISSLCAAGASTKIVIAGDSKQVGPYVVVLGEEARQHGLKKSLLERLEERYEQIGRPLSQYIQRLGVNYRCHPILTSFLADVMYNYPISCGITNFVIHPANPQSPCVFHCYDVNVNKKSSVSFEALMELEADAIIDQVSKYCTYRDVCIISSNRNQLNIIKRKLASSPLRHIQLLPSYLVQGHEFQAVFLSTLEHLDSNGKSSNPTKSLVTPRIFNTVLSRSKSLVVAIGNPFSLLKLETAMGGSEKCWKKYLKLCLETRSVTFDKGVPAKSNIEKELESLVGAVPAPTHSSKVFTSHMSASSTHGTAEHEQDLWHTVTKVKPQRSQESRRTVNDYKQRKQQRPSSARERDDHKRSDISMNDYFPSSISQASKRTHSKKKKK